MEAVEIHEKHNLWSNLRKRYLKFQLSLTPQQNLLYGFISYTVIGWLLLCLPLFHKQPVAWLDNLFIATSAISTTGLTTVSVIDSYNWGGQFITLLLIQIGGVGYMTFTSFIMLSMKSELTHWHQRILNSEFAMPKGFQINDFIRSVIVFTILIETLGAISLYIVFQRAGVDHNFALWSSIYHSVSAFCTAGFGLYSNSFENFAGNTSLNIVISVLSIFGSLGFIVVTDFWNRITGKTKVISFTTKIILLVTGVLSLAGTILIYAFEPTVRAYPGFEKIQVSFFQSMTALTTVGFNTIPINNLSLPMLLIIVLLMYVGASPSGTGGGMKSTTFVALIAIMVSRIRARRRVTFLGKAIPLERMYVATSTFMLYAAVIFMATFLLSITDSTFSLQNILFEITSAIGTVGLSTGITSALSASGKLVVIAVMFIGRIGVITFGLAILAKRKQQVDEKDEKADLAV
ncbi:MAG: potassium transporter TrkH [Cyclobacteriaceae bacterium]|nr:potassium transporter TrkH [Cyclobacteriaceae bacterium]